MTLYAIQINRKGALLLDHNGVPHLFRTKTDARTRARWDHGKLVRVTLTKRIRSAKFRCVWVLLDNPDIPEETYSLSEWRRTPRMYVTRQLARWNCMTGQGVERRYLNVVGVPCRV